MNISVIVKIMNLLQQMSLPDPFTVIDVLHLLGAGRSASNDVRAALRRLQAEGRISKVIEFRPGAYGRQLEKWTTKPIVEPWQAIESLIASNLEYLPMYFRLKDAMRLVGVSAYYQAAVNRALNSLHDKRLIVLVDAKTVWQGKGRPTVVWSADPNVVKQELEFEAKMHA